MRHEWQGQNINRNIANCSVFSLKFRFCQVAVAQLILAATGVLPAEKLWFSLDRTNWKFGKTNHNILVLAVQIGDVAVPILWKSLGKAGNSGHNERIELMQILLKFFPKEQIVGLLADREFIGGEWLGWLVAEEIPFIIRIKDNVWIRLKDGRKFKVYEYLKAMPRAVNSHVMEDVVFESGVVLNMQAKRHGGELIVVVFCGGFEAQPLNLYRKRWRIECGFQAIKTKGFNLEDTHLQHQERMETLFSLVIIAMAFCVAAGKIVKSPARKNHGYNANCRFTLGLKSIIHSLLQELLQKSLGEPAPPKPKHINPSKLFVV